MLKTIEERRDEGKRRRSSSRSRPDSKSPPRIGDEQSQER
jgi:sentrin-specific protease 8